LTIQYNTKNLIDNVTNMRILIVEDDEHIREMLKLGFEEESFAVDLAENGEKGSYIARTNEYDIIILDLLLPIKSGLDICRDIRTNSITTPIIMLSATFEIQEKIRLLNSGADDYVTKPFSFHELLARVRALLRRPKPIAPDTIRVDDLSLDSIRQKVSRGSKSIYLTRKEFSLLEYLMRHEGVVVSRGMIMEHVWNRDSDPFSNTIEAHILNVRKKVDMAKHRKLIHTIPGRGYKIEAFKEKYSKV
jgi:two-component system copper resistance phosphate regulon response regulator CusR